MARAGGVGAWPIVVVVGLPLAAAALLAARPALDGRWQEPTVHFWLVGLAAAAGVVVAGLAAEAASRRGDARLQLLGLSFAASAGFLLAHAIATPGVLADSSNNAFEAAVPVGLALSAAIAALATLDLGPAAASRVLRLRAVAWAAVAVAVTVVAVAAPAGWGVLADSPDERPVDGVVAAVGIAGTLLYAFAGLRLLAMARLRGRTRLVTSLVVTVVLLADALVVVLVGRNWQASWWEWHALMGAGFVVLAATARREWRLEGGRVGLFDGLALERTLESVRRDYAAALDDLVQAMDRGDDADLAPLVQAVVRRFGLSDRQGDLLAQAARALGENRRLYRELDGLFRSYLSPDVAAALVAQPDRAALGGAVTEVSVLHADLSGFTAFAERHEPTEVMAMLNTYFGAVVPAILAEGGTITLFAGDAVMAVFGAPSTQADHAARACRAALALQEAAEAARGDESWPRFRVGVSTGPAIVGNVGSDALRSFTAIGDTVNLAARIEAAAPVGGVLASAETAAAAGDAVRCSPSGTLSVKGRDEPVVAYAVTG